MPSPFFFVILAAAFLLPSFAFPQSHQPQAINSPSAKKNDEPAAVSRGRTAFQSNCGFCHGNDATGNRAPDLLRSTSLSHDEAGNIVGGIIRNGRVDKGMPAFPNLKDNSIADIVAFLHYQANQALRSGHIPGDYPAAKLLTGNAEAGRAYFNGEGKCNECHSPSGDLSGIAKKYSPIDLQQRLVYPSSKGKVERTAVVVTKEGKRFDGEVAHADEFTISLKCADGWIRTWDVDAVQTTVNDRLAVHRQLTTRYTDADMHNLFAYLETLQ